MAPGYPTSPRFFCPFPLKEGARVDLPENAARHAGKVLRLRSGDALVLFNGLGGEYAGRVNRVESGRVAVDVEIWHDVERESPLSITLVQSLQSGEKMDMTVQKAVELGVSRIAPVVSRRSVLRLEGDRARRRLEHWRGVIVSACEQCGRNRLPEIDMPLNLTDWLRAVTSNGAENTALGTLRLALLPDASNPLSAHRPTGADGGIEILVGPEGGFDPEEIQLMLSAGFSPVRLGPRVLRTETAAMAAIAAIQGLWGDFGKETGYV